MCSSTDTDRKCEVSAENTVFSKDFCAALDNSNIPVYIIDPDDFKIVYCNNQVSRYIEKNPVGCACYKALVNNEKPCGDCIALKLMNTGDGSPIEFYNPMGFWGLVHAFYLDWKGHRYIQVTFVDITKQKRLEEELRTRSEEYGAVVRQGITGILRYDIDSDTASLNIDKNLEPCEEYSVHNYFRLLLNEGFILPDSFDDAKNVLMNIRKGRESEGYDFRIKTPDKGIRWCHLDYTLIKNAEGRPYKAVAFFSDNTEQRERELAFQLWNKRLNTVMNDYTAYMEVNLTRDVIEAESRIGSWDKVTGGRCFSEFVEEMARIGINQQDRSGFRQFFNRQRLLGQFSEGHSEGSFEYRAVVDGKSRWYKAEVQMVVAPDSDIKASVIYNDVDDEVRERERLTRQAERDAMTGLYNHATAEYLINKYLEEKSGERCCFLMIDLDDLRDINSTMGHPEGDRALQSIADCMREQFGMGDILGRIGGDEFVALLCNIKDETEVKAKISAFMKRLGKAKIGAQDDKPVQASVGGSIGRVGDTDFKTLYEQADLALFYTKANGKNSYNLYTPELENREFNYKPRSVASLTNLESIESSEFSKLLKAMASFFPLVISVNLTKNSYYMMEYETYASQRARDDGSFDELIADGASAFHPDDRPGFLHCFKRENMLKAYAEGKRSVEHVGRQLGDDGIYRMVQTVAIMMEDESGDICEISFTHVLFEEHETASKRMTV